MSVGESGKARRYQTNLADQRIKTCNSVSQGFTEYPLNIKLTKEWTVHKIVSLFFHELTLLAYTHELVSGFGPFF